MKRILGYCTLFLSTSILTSSQNWVQYVDPFIGTGGHGHTFPGATLPFAMVQLSPDTRVDGSWDGCSGYHYSDNTIYGFSHTHLSGTGCSDYGDVMLMPVQKDISFDPKIYSSKFSHQNESATPGYYSVLLDDEGIKVELTATTRAGLHRYTFSHGGKASVILDLSHRDELLGFELKKTGDNRVMGMRRSKAWAEDQYVFFTIEFSRPITAMAYCIDGKVIDGPKDPIPATYKKVQVRFDFDLGSATNLEVKVGLSPVDMPGSQVNMQTETGTRTFDEIKQLAADAWNKELGKIEVQGGTRGQLVNFYTALYHCMIAPNIYMDTDNRYRGRDNQIHTAVGFSYYTVFSLWDTFRALHPLLTIIDRQRSKDFAQTFLAQYQQGGRLPVWELSANETDCMIGYHSVSVLADIAAKGLMTDEQIKLAYEAAVKSATWNHLGLPAIMDHGFIAVDDESESVSKTLEYAYDDWCIARLGEMAGKTKEELNPFYIRAQGFVNVFDTESKFFRPRKNGGWLSPFEPREVNNNYTEANAWQYRFFVPHDVPRTLYLMGGKERYINKLDSMFTITSQTTGREQADITGCIGQYAHGNEPSHSFAYLFVHAGLPWKTQHYVRMIMDSLYRPTLDGLPGNEDCGQMSAWYVFSAMGMYPVTPGVAYYTWGTPLFEQVTINLDNGNKVRIKRSGGDASCRYIGGVAMNGVTYTGNGIDHNSLMFGPEITFTMQATPKNISGWGAPEGIFIDREYSKIFTPVPVIISEGMSFDEKITIKIESLLANSSLLYAIQGADSTLSFQPYTQPLTIDHTCTVYAKAISSTGVESPLGKARFVKRPNHWKVTILSQYNPQYNAGGDGGISDGILGEEDWRKGGWQGYQGQDMEIVLDLLQPTALHSIGSRYLQDTRAWIVMPKKVEYYTSDDGINFTLAGAVTNTLKDDVMSTVIKNLRLDNVNRTARYVKVKAYTYGKLPAWHPGAGGDAFIFCDEIIIE